MKIFLDDIREAPEGWKQTDNARNTIRLLTIENVSEISLDHDLGDDENNRAGYDVLEWIEKQVFLNDYIPPKIYIHTANSSARAKMEAALKKKVKTMNNEYIKLEDCRHGALYRIGARNFSFGIYDEYNQSFVGIRTKFGMRSLFPEFHWDTGPPYGTVKPLEFLEQSPFVDSNLRHIYINNKEYYLEMENWLNSKIDEYNE